MHAFGVVVLACLTCTTFARRVQTASPQTQVSAGEVDSSSRSQSFVEVGSSVGFHPTVLSAHAIPRAHATSHKVASSRISNLAVAHPSQESSRRSTIVASVSGGKDNEQEGSDKSHEAAFEKTEVHLGTESTKSSDEESSNRRGIIGFFFLLAAAVIDKFGTAPPGTPAVATPEKSGGVESEISLKGVTGINRFRLACWKFVRPHTIRGTILGSSAVTLRVILENPAGFNWALIPRAVLGVLCLLCGNGYIVGINQIYDVDIDTINKPFLPIAAGELSKAAGWALCLVFAAAGLAISAVNFGPLITGLYAFGLLLGTVYSIPPLRLKRFPVPAFLIIATVRGFLLNFGVYYAARAAMQLPFAWSPTILFATCFVTWFATVIAVSKDLPDIEGDRANGVESFAVRLGADKLSYIAAGMLVALYGVGAALPIVFPASFRFWLMTPLHLIIAGLVVRASLRLRASNWSQPGIKSFYRFVWSIFYTSYIFLPFLAPLPRMMTLA